MQKISGSDGFMFQISGRYPRSRASAMFTQSWYVTLYLVPCNSLTRLPTTGLHLSVSHASDVPSNIALLQSLRLFSMHQNIQPDFLMQLLHCHEASSLARPAVFCP